MDNGKGESFTSTRRESMALPTPQALTLMFLFCAEWYRPSLDELTLETRVSAHPMPRVTWLLNGSPLRVSDRYEQQQLSDGTCRLIVRGPDPATDSGRYTCRAANLVSTDHVAHTVQFTGKFWSGLHAKIIRERECVPLFALQGARTTRAEASRRSPHRPRHSARRGRPDSLASRAPSWTARSPSEELWHCKSRSLVRTENLLGGEQVKK